MTTSPTTDPTSATQLRPDGSTRTRFRLDDDACQACAGDVATVLGRLPGIHGAEVLSAAGVVVVDHDSQLAPETLRRQAATANINLLPVQPRPARPGPPWWRQGKFIALAAASLLLVAGLAVDKLAGQRGWAVTCYVATLLLAGFHPTRVMWQALRSGRPTISILLLAAVGAVGLGLLEEAAVLVVVFSLGQILEDFAGDRVRGSIRALMALAPPTAQRTTPDGATETVDVQALIPGDQVLVRPGGRLPTDGTVIAGTSAVDQSPITGESVPVEVGPGTGVYAGTINGTGTLTVRVTKHHTDTTLARTIRQVEDAQASKGRAQRFADRFGAVYGLGALGLAALVALVPPLLVGDFSGWLYRGLVVLTVACSCALLISVPVAVVAAIARGARTGILIKGGIYLEALAKVRTIAFDKTGTLTRGTPTLTKVVPLDGADSDEILRLAASVEAASEHPLAQAILTAAHTRSLTLPTGHDAVAIPGVGIHAIVEGHHVFVGKPAAPTDGNGNGTNPATQEVVRLADQLEADGNTVVMVTADQRQLGLLAVADQLRDTVPQVIASLRGLGIDHIVLLSGDNPRVAQAIATAAGIDDWRAGLLPEDKTAAVHQLRAQHGAIAMVGDGVNDAPALATADIGIAMGAVGTDVALETADVALMADDLTKLPEAVRLARQAQATIRQNIIMSLATVVILVTAALAGWLSLTTGLVLNEATALLIIANGLRLARTPNTALAKPALATANPLATAAPDPAETCCTGSSTCC